MLVIPEARGKGKAIDFRVAWREEIVEREVRRLRGNIVKLENNFCFWH